MVLANEHRLLQDTWWQQCESPQIFADVRTNIFTLRFSAVYFNPAKTFGGMLEADTFCFVGLLFAAFVSLSSMSMYWFFEVQPGWEWLADSLVILWIGASMSSIAWMKLWMAKPTFNTGMAFDASSLRQLY